MLMATVRLVFAADTPGIDVPGLVNGDVLHRVILIHHKDKGIGAQIIQRFRGVWARYCSATGPATGDRSCGVNGGTDSRNGGDGCSQTAYVMKRPMT